MNEFEILIIGAGVSGLMAARELSRKMKKVAVLEARERCGGRIFTMKSNDFSIPLETGAEFVHGKLPLTRSLSQEAKIKFSPMTGGTYQIKEGKMLESDEFIEGFGELIKKLKQLKEDIPFAQFLKKYFGDSKYESLRESVRRYAEGYDAADITRVSSFALKDEWISEENSGQYRLEGGYSSLVNYLENESRVSRCIIHLSTIVKEIRWKKGNVEVISEDGRNFTADKVLITVPLGVLQQPEQYSKSYIRFSPGIGQLQDTVKQMGYGPVIKIFLEFKETFWNDYKRKEPGISQAPDLSFLISDALVPTWWTQVPDKTPLLTGWLAGPNAEVLKHSDERSLIAKAFDSLAYLFGGSSSFYKDRLVAAKAVNWTADPFSLGAYSYATVESNKVIKQLSESIENTIFFAGEAVYQGPAMGTVEAALSSAVEASKHMSQ